MDLQQAEYITERQFAQWSKQGTPGHQIIVQNRNHTTQFLKKVQQQVRRLKKSKQVDSISIDHYQRLSQHQRNKIRQYMQFTMKISKYSNKKLSPQTWHVQTSKNQIFPQSLRGLTIQEFQIGQGYQLSDLNQKGYFRVNPVTVCKNWSSFVVFTPATLQKNNLFYVDVNRSIAPYKSPYSADITKADDFFESIKRLYQMTPLQSITKVFLNFGFQLSDAPYYVQAQIQIASFLATQVLVCQTLLNKDRKQFVSRVSSVQMVSHSLVNTLLATTTNSFQSSMKQSLENIHKVCSTFGMEQLFSDYKMVLQKSLTSFSDFNGFSETIDRGFIKDSSWQKLSQIIQKTSYLYQSVSLLYTLQKSQNYTKQQICSFIVSSNSIFTSFIQQYRQSQVKLSILRKQFLQLYKQNKKQMINAKRYELIYILSTPFFIYFKCVTTICLINIQDIIAYVSKIAQFSNSYAKQLRYVITRHAKTVIQLSQIAYKRLLKIVKNNQALELSNSLHHKYVKNQFFRKQQFQQHTQMHRIQHFCLSQLQIYLSPQAYNEYSKNPFVFDPEKNGVNGKNLQIFKSLHSIVSLYWTFHANVSTGKKNFHQQQQAFISNATKKIKQSIEYLVIRLQDQQKQHNEFLQKVSGQIDSLKNQNHQTLKIYQKKHSSFAGINVKLQHQQSLIRMSQSLINNRIDDQQKKKQILKQIRQQLVQQNKQLRINIQIQKMNKSQEQKYLLNSLSLQSINSFAPGVQALKLSIAHDIPPQKIIQQTTTSNSVEIQRMIIQNSKPIIDKVAINPNGYDIKKTFQKQNQYLEMVNQLKFQQGLQSSSGRKEKNINKLKLQVQNLSKIIVIDPEDAEQQIRQLHKKSQIQKRKIVIDLLEEKLVNPQLFKDVQKRLSKKKRSVYLSIDDPVQSALAGKKQILQNISKLVLQSSKQIQKQGITQFSQNNIQIIDQMIKQKISNLDISQLTQRQKFYYFIQLSQLIIQKQQLMLNISFGLPTVVQKLQNQQDKIQYVTRYYQNLKRTHQQIVDSQQILRKIDSKSKFIATRYFKSSGLVSVDNANQFTKKIKKGFQMVNSYIQSNNSQQMKNIIAKSLNYGVQNIKKVGYNFSEQYVDRNVKIQSNIMQQQQYQQQQQNVQIPEHDQNLVHLGQQNQIVQKYSNKKVKFQQQRQNMFYSQNKNFDNSPNNFQQAGLAQNIKDISLPNVNIPNQNFQQQIQTLRNQNQVLKMIQQSAVSQRDSLFYEINQMQSAMLDQQFQVTDHSKALQALNKVYQKILQKNNIAALQLQNKTKKIQQLYQKQQQIIASYEYKIQQSNRYIEQIAIAQKQLNLKVQQLINEINILQNQIQHFQSSKKYYQDLIQQLRKNQVFLLSEVKEGQKNKKMVQQLVQNQKILIQQAQKGVQAEIQVKNLREVQITLKKQIQLKNQQIARHQEEIRKLQFKQKQKTSSQQAISKQVLQSRAQILKYSQLKTQHLNQIQTLKQNIDKLNSQVKQAKKYQKAAQQKKMLEQKYQNLQKTFEMFKKHVQTLQLEYNALKTQKQRLQLGSRDLYQQEKIKKQLQKVNNQLSKKTIQFSDMYLNYQKIQQQLVQINAILGINNQKPAIQMTLLQVRKLFFEKGELDKKLKSLQQYHNQKLTQLNNQIIYKQKQLQGLQQIIQQNVQQVSVSNHATDQLLICQKQKSQLQIQIIQLQKQINNLSVELKNNSIQLQTLRRNTQLQLQTIQSMKTQILSYQQKMNIIEQTKKQIKLNEQIIDSVQQKNKRQAINKKKQQLERNLYVLEQRSQRDRFKIQKIAFILGVSSQNDIYADLMKLKDQYVKSQSSQRQTIQRQISRQNQKIQRFYERFQTKIKQYLNDTTKKSEPTVKQDLVKIQVHGNQLIRHQTLLAHHRSMVQQQKKNVNCVYGAIKQNLGKAIKYLQKFQQIMRFGLPAIENLFPDPAKRNAIKKCFQILSKVITQSFNFIKALQAGVHNCQSDSYAQQIQKLIDQAERQMNGSPQINVKQQRQQKPLTLNHLPPPDQVTKVLFKQPQKKGFFGKFW